MPLGVVGGGEKGLYFHSLGSFILRNGEKRGTPRNVTRFKTDAKSPKPKAQVRDTYLGAPALSNIGELNSAA